MSRYQGGIITKSSATPTGPNPLTGRAPGVWRLDDVAYWIRQGVWPDASADAYWPYTSLLLSSTSLSNANNNLFVDSSGAFNPISRNGNATQGGATPYGSFWSNYFDGTGDYLASSTGIGDFGTGDFTVEYWALNDKVQGTNFAPQVGTLADASPSNTWRFGTFSSTGYLAFPYHTGSTFIDLFFGTTNYNDGVWHHYAACRSGSTLRVFVDGVQVGSNVTLTQNLTSGKALQVGREGFSPTYYTGNISNLRICKATALYTANFTPSSSPLTAITGTTFLSCQSNRFIDNSSNAYAITANGNTAISKFSPFTLASPGISYNQSDITNWSGYFDGSGDYLSIPNSAAFSYGTGDFTVEAWVYKTATSGDRAVLDSYTIGSGSGTFGFLINNTQINAYQTNVATYTFTYTVPNNSWNHIAFVRTGGNLICYVNGTSIGSQANSANFISSSTVQIGRNAGSGGSQWIGSISNLRIVKGTAVYTSNFTPSTTNLTAISGTSLLTLQNAAFTDNSTNNFIVTPFGNTTVTGNSPFNTVGYWSNYFDGSGDYFTVPYTTANFDWYTAGVDFTIEYWFFAGSLTGTSYVDGGTTKSTVVGNRSATTTTDYWSFGPNAGGTVTFYYFNGGPVVVNSTATITANTWNHVAMTKTSSGITIFVNGVAQTTTAISGTPQSSASFPLTIGQGNNTSYNGYVSNLRIVRGTAIYSGNFTVPTAPLTAVANTKLLTCQNGSFIDNSTNALTLTVTGDTSVQSFDPFYTATIASNGGSMYLDGTGDYLRSSIPPLNIRVRFTIEGWVYLSTVTNFVFFSGSTTAGAAGQALYLNELSGTVYFGDGVTNNISFSNSLLPINSWAHIACTFDGTTYRVFINGTSAGSSTSLLTNYTLNSIDVGARLVSVTNYATGYIGNFRITGGTALYTSAFTPPTAPLTPSANTTLLVNGMNAGAYDATAINNMETVGNAQVSTAVSKFGGSSMYFDGSGDYLVAPSSPAYAFGTGNFTLEGWFYPTASANQALFEMRNSTTSTSGIAVRLLASSNTLRVIMNNTALFTTSTAVLLNQWSHIAVVRSSGTVTAYLNGVAMTGGSASGSTSLTDNTLWIGELRDGSFQWNGYMDDLRITNGVARYTANFTPPTQAFPPY
jgi:hypothetical protein